jgi:methylated-DNA-protein-cysteine methyltransferase-like protein
MQRADRSQLPFPDRVALVVERIPEGFVTTYGRIAAALGSPKAARMVGWALNGQVDGHRIPAHRVVNRVGVLSGAPAFGAPGRMRELLEAEMFLFSTTSPWIWKRACGTPQTMLVWLTCSDGAWWQGPDQIASSCSRIGHTEDGRNDGDSVGTR